MFLPPAPWINCRHFWLYAPLSCDHPQSEEEEGEEEEWEEKAMEGHFRETGADEKEDETYMDATG